VSVFSSIVKFNFQETAVAVQKSRKSRSKRGMRRAHDALGNPALSVDSTSGETHYRHHITADGYYKGRKVISTDDAFDDE